MRTVPRIDARQNARSWFFRREAVFAPHRDPALGQRRERPGMQHFGSVVGQLGSLGVGDFRKNAGIRDQARITAHDAVDVGPDPQLRRVQHRSQNRRRKIRAPAPERRRTMVQRGSIESGNDRHLALGE